LDGVEVVWAEDPFTDRQCALEEGPADPGDMTSGVPVDLLADARPRPSGTG
jgi:hypothetical protein